MNKQINELENMIRLFKLAYKNRIIKAEEGLKNIASLEKELKRICKKH